MTAPASPEPTAQPSLPDLRVAFRSPSHFLISYCTNVHQGILFVQSEPGLEVGQELRLNLHIPGQSCSHLLPATVRWTRERASLEGPPGLGLSFDGCEEILAPIVDRLVQIAQPLRIDLVGANAYTTRHLASSVQTAVECRIQHRELRHDVVQRCMGADLVLVDLESNSQAALEMIEELSHCSAPPAILALCDEEDQAKLEEACLRAYVTTYPVDRRALRDRIIQGLAQCSKSPDQCRSGMQDTMPLATVSASPRQRAPAQAARSEESIAARPARLSLHPVHRQKTAQPWLVDASWQQRPQRREQAAPEDSLGKSSEKRRGDATEDSLEKLLEEIMTGSQEQVAPPDDAAPSAELPEPAAAQDNADPSAELAEEPEPAVSQASAEPSSELLEAPLPKAAAPQDNAEASPEQAEQLALEDTLNDPLRSPGAPEESAEATGQSASILALCPTILRRLSPVASAPCELEPDESESHCPDGSLCAAQSPVKSATLEESAATPEFLEDAPTPSNAIALPRDESPAQQQGESSPPQRAQDAALADLQSAEDVGAADPSDSPANDPRSESPARKSA